MTKVVLHIDRLVLRGVPAAERDAVVAGLKAALAREFALPGVAERLASTGHRDAVRARFAAPAGAQALGRDAGRHMAAGVRR
ncbi:hypothetical protein [Variovorax sp. PBL-E5]|uniref:hypothetical protein n=1 Tax=Variovorax sp. PBL-E5 TaxID=434014 RepID=UPI001317487E|nr:hypothetical protein [Variovorax sp. PBL-E5]VTU35480.1 hypothetical protein E5CHR_04075 [Variovorax sp. PBL-E5]